MDNSASNELDFQRFSTSFAPFFPPKAKTMISLMAEWSSFLSGRIRTMLEGSFEVGIEKTGFLLEFTPLQNGAGMTSR
jgi:hypothetical protein